MSEFLYAASGFVLLMLVLDLYRVLRGPGEADRLMSAQLVGTNGVGILLLLAAATEAFAVIDVALLLALLAAFSSVAFVNSASSKITSVDTEGDP